MAVTAGECLEGGGEAGAHLRAIDWSRSPLGPVAGWPDALRSGVRLVLDASAPASLIWGPEQLLFYNDAYAPKMGGRHPEALGQPADRWISDMIAAQARLHQTLSNAQIIGLWDWRVREDVVVADRRFAELYGVDPERAAAGAPIAEFVHGVHPEDRDRLGEAIAVSLATGDPFACEYRLKDRAGVVRHVLARGQPTRDSGGRPARLAGATIDITAQRLAEVALSSSDERYQALFNSIDVGFCIIEMIFDGDGRPVDYLFEEVNPAFVRHTGLTDAVGRRMRDMAPDHEQHWFDTYGKVVRTGEPVRVELRADALNRWYAAHAFRVGEADSRRVAVLFSDISETKAGELKLRASESQFRTFAQAMPNHVWTSPPDGQLDWFNSRVYDYSGMQAGELDGVGWTAMVHPDDLRGAAERWASALVAGHVYETEFRLRRSDGAYRWHIARAVPIRTDAGEVTRWIGTNTDIEDQKAAADALAGLNAALEIRVEQRTRELLLAEQALRQSQKMDAIGQLTGGIAHDFNNLMTGILSALALVKRRIASGRADEIGDLMDAAGASANRAAALTHRLLAFARQQSLEARAIDVRELVDGMRFLLNQTLGENITMDVVFAEDLWPARCDANQLENAILNLVINARDAMPGGGRLSIEVGNDIVSPSDPDARREETPGEYVVVTVADTGTGMTPEVAAKAFDPFFTTKPIGQGTGLGLSMIYGFAKQSGGHVRIDSTPGDGARLSLFLPRAGEAPIASAAESATLHRAVVSAASILVVEDDPTVRLMVTTALEDWGYRHIACKDAQEALEVLRSPKAIDLMLSDVGLPGMDGRRLAELAREARPHLGVVFMTGYAEKAAVREKFLAPGMDMLTKPFTLDALADKLRERLPG